MKESTICNVRLAKIGGLYFINLRGPNGNNTSTNIAEKQALRLRNELEIPIKDYDSEFTTEGKKAEAGNDNDNSADLR